MAGSVDLSALWQVIDSVRVNTECLFFFGTGVLFGLTGEQPLSFEKVHFHWKSPVTEDGADPGRCSSHESRAISDCPDNLETEASS